MKKTLTAVALSSLISLPVAANDLERPPVFKPSAETLDREKRQHEAQLEEKNRIAEQKRREAEYIFPDGHDPRDHDHDHDDDLDHEHDDPIAHQKQLEELEAKGIKNESSWWQFW